MNKKLNRRALLKLGLTATAAGSTPPLALAQAQAQGEKQAPNPDYMGVLVDTTLCIGCRYCQVACAFEIPAYESDEPLTPRVRKCEFCADRAKGTGANPACAASCPTETLVFGRRSELLTMAKDRLERRPDRYINHVYGEKEVGGTSWLYLVVLTVEMSPAFLEGLKARIDRDEWGAAQLRKVETPLPTLYVAVKIALPMFIVAGVVLSFMHQSSLGTLMLIAPSKMSSLWYTPILPVLFLLSAIMVGFPMVILESIYANISFGRNPEMELLTPMARKIPWFLGAYGVVKIGDLIVRHNQLDLLDSALLETRSDDYEPVAFSHRIHDGLTGGDCEICHHRFASDEKDRVGNDIKELHASIEIKLGGPCARCHKGASGAALPGHRLAIYPEVKDRIDFKALGYDDDPALVGGRFQIDIGRGSPVR